VNGGFLLDTNIPSELMRPSPALKVTDRVAAQDISTLFLSGVSIGQLESGFTTTPDAARRARLEKSLDRHLAVTQAIAARWGGLNGIHQLAGRPLGAPDGMIAATPLEHGLTRPPSACRNFSRRRSTTTTPARPM